MELVEKKITNDSAPKAELENLLELVTRILEDIDICTKHLDEEDSQFWRRTYIRTLFSMVEGITYRMKQAALANFNDRMSGPQTPELRSYPIYLSEADTAMLKELSFDLNEKGEAYTQPKFIPIIKNVKFAFSSLARSQEANFELKLNRSGWVAFQNSLRIRNRLTHPKNSTELVVSDEELSHAKDAFQWFLVSFEGVCSSCMESCILRIEAAKKILAKHQEEKERPERDAEHVVGPERG
jgi:hypothetical protein